MIERSAITPPDNRDNDTQKWGEKRYLNGSKASTLYSGKVLISTGDTSPMYSVIPRATNKKTIQNTQKHCN